MTYALISLILVLVTAIIGLLLIICALRSLAGRQYEVIKNHDLRIAEAVNEAKFYHANYCTICHARTSAALMPLKMVSDQELAAYGRMQTGTLIFNTTKKVVMVFDGGYWKPTYVDYRG